MPATILRLVFLGSAVFQIVLAYGFVARAPWALRLWPWEDTRLSYLFCGAVLAALGAGSLWVAATGRWRAALPSLAGLAVMFGAMGAFLGLGGEGVFTAPPELVAAFAATALAALVLLVLLRAPDGAPTPLGRMARASCTVFAAVLGLAGLALLIGLPAVFPWPLSPQSATMFGLAFLGLALVYGLTALWGERDMGAVALLGFLVYDLVLLPPFLLHFAKVAPAHMPSLIVYVAVLIYSLGLSAWFLVSRMTRPA
jgi:hypothetical protein